jgi:putative transposase
MARLPKLLPRTTTTCDCSGAIIAQKYSVPMRITVSILKIEIGCDKHGCSVHEYVLMINHVHLLITRYLEQSLDKVMQMLGRYHVQC